MTELWSGHGRQKSDYILQTRWVAVYLEINCNIGSKRAFPTGVLDR